MTKKRFHFFSLHDYFCWNLLSQRYLLLSSIFLLKKKHLVQLYATIELQKITGKILLHENTPK